MKPSRFDDDRDSLAALEAADLAAFARRFLIILILAVLVMVTAITRAAEPAPLRLLVGASFRGRPLTFDVPVETGGPVITRFDFLISQLAFRRTDGTWIALSDWAGYVSLREGRRTLEVPRAPTGSYDRVRFAVGLDPATNQREPAQWPPGHALNPVVNGLHWGSDAGFVFLALEGFWQTRDGARRGFSHHLATDERLMTVELPLPSAADLPAEWLVTVDVATILSGVTLDERSSSTHSRRGDELADRLQTNVARAFSVAPAATDPTPAPEVARTRRLLSPEATPYRLTIPAYFPRPALPLDNPLTNEGVELGRRLFFDQRLSGNHTQSCASCHQPALAFADQHRRVSTGATGTLGTRNAMPLANLAWNAGFFWDGRARTLREQVLQPVTNPSEMHADLDTVVARLRADPAYPALFRDAFGEPVIDADRMARALEQFLLTRLAADSKFDRVLRRTAQFSAEEQRGFDLFQTESDPRRGQFGADCFHCHGGPLFRSQPFANNGLDVESKDWGRALVTGRDGDRGKFAVPSLRNVEVTAPYMHDGRFSTLEEVVAHYARGVQRSPTLDPNLAKHPGPGVPISPPDQRALVAFLRTLTDESLRSPNAAVALHP